MSEQMAFDSVAAEAHARSTDPWTSHAAARSITEDKLRQSQFSVLLAFRHYGPMHHELLVQRYVEDNFRPWQSVSGLRTRTKELCDAGFIEDTGRTVILRSGRHSKVWQAK